METNRKKAPKHRKTVQEKDHQQHVDHVALEVGEQRTLEANDHAPRSTLATPTEAERRTEDWNTRADEAKVNEMKPKRKIQKGKNQSQRKWPKKKRGDRRQMTGSGVAIPTTLGESPTLSRGATATGRKGGKLGPGWQSPLP